MMKHCPRCHSSKPATPEFYHRNRARHDGLAAQCKECFSAIDSKRYAANPLKKKVLSHSWYSSNKQRKAAVGKLWSEKNIDRKREIVRNCLARRRKIDPTFRLGEAVAIQVRRHAQRVGSWRGIVGYSLETLCAHLEARFTPDMTWENYGSFWQIDHIRPVSDFDLPREIIECWELRNLRPLPAVENMAKGSKVIPELIKARAA